eukprot:scaffold4494_cov161-Amphora_coffeaeformis.AAC.4
MGGQQILEIPPMKYFQATITEPNQGQFQNERNAYVRVSMGNVFGFECGLPRGRENLHLHAHGRTCRKNTRLNRCTGDGIDGTALTTRTSYGPNRSVENPKIKWMT